MVEVAVEVLLAALSIEVHLAELGIGVFLGPAFGLSQLLEEPLVLLKKVVAESALDFLLAVVQPLEVLLL